MTTESGVLKVHEVTRLEKEYAIDIDTYLVFVHDTDNVCEHGANLWSSLVLVGKLRGCKYTVGLLIVHVSSLKTTINAPSAFLHARMAP